MSLVAELESLRLSINHWTRAIEGLKAAEEIAKMLPEMNMVHLQYLFNKLQTKDAKVIREYLNFLGNKDYKVIHFPKPYSNAYSDPTSDWEASGKVLSDAEKRSLIGDMENACSGLQQAFHYRLSSLEGMYPNPQSGGQLIDPVYRALFVAMRCIYYESD